MNTPSAQQARPFLRASARNCGPKQALVSVQQRYTVLYTAAPMDIVICKRWVAHRGKRGDAPPAIVARNKRLFRATFCAMYAAVSVSMSSDKKSNRDQIEIK